MVLEAGRLVDWVDRALLHLNVSFPFSGAAMDIKDAGSGQMSKGNNAGIRLLNKI